MGLDICVRKILKKPKDKEDYFSLVDDNGNYDNHEFPEWTKTFENEVIESWFDWNKYKEETGIDIDQCEWLGESYGEDGSFMTLWPNNAGKRPNPSDFKTENGDFDVDSYDAARDKHIIRVDLENVPTYQKAVKVLYYEEVGYQRKGFNAKFYDDYKAGKIGYYCWSKAELGRYKKDYCVDDEVKEYFQKNIIDKFTDGETCCIFSW